MAVPVAAHIPNWGLKFRAASANEMELLRMRPEMLDRRSFIGMVVVVVVVVVMVSEEQLMRNSSELIRI